MLLKYNFYSFDSHKKYQISNLYFLEYIKYFMTGLKVNVRPLLIHVSLVHMRYFV